ncbi:unnamed protein product [Clonostachys rosea]|uniref:Uncharacterized protein n=1 Tax=Bionectria ochroleuca TaxID=29856 RepID=A0ABY6US44_BIOOC|nr:unnamed protein product [Clonostachys rosea]
MSILNSYSFFLFFGDIETLVDENCRVIQPGEEIMNVGKESVTGKDVKEHPAPRQITGQPAALADKIGQANMSAATREGVMIKYQQVFNDMDTLEIDGSTFKAIRAMTMAEKRVLPKIAKQKFYLLFKGINKKLTKEMKSMLDQDELSAENGT